MATEIRPERARTAPSDVAEPVDPEVQEHVVERRRAVALQRLVEVAERQLGDVDGQRLVEPQITRRDEAQYHCGQKREPDPDPGKEGPPVAGPRLHAVQPNTGVSETLSL